MRYPGWLRLWFGYDMRLVSIRVDSKAELQAAVADANRRRGRKAMQWTMGRTPE